MAAGTKLGPLAGISTAHKDMFDRAGHVTGYGAKMIAGLMASPAATVLARLDRAGQSDLGHLILSEYAIGPTGHNAHHGMPPSFTMQGPALSDRPVAADPPSSLVWLLAVWGSDTGWSIPLPAACCGVVGFKQRQNCMPAANVMRLTPSRIACARLRIPSPMPPCCCA